MRHLNNKHFELSSDLFCLRDDSFSEIKVQKIVYELSGLQPLPHFILPLAQFTKGVTYRDLIHVGAAGTKVTFFFFFSGNVYCQVNKSQNPLENRSVWNCFIILQSFAVVSAVPKAEQN